MTDDMCLYQPRVNERTLDTGSMCLRDMNILVANNIITSSWEPQGVLGLAPGQGANSFVQRLYDQGAIKQRVVGLNFENPDDTDQASTVTFGELDYNQIEGGVDGLNYYNNLGVDKWGLLMDDFLYGD